MNTWRGDRRSGGSKEGKGRRGRREAVGNVRQRGKSVMTLRFLPKKLDRWRRLLETEEERKIRVSGMEIRFSIPVEMLRWQL